MFDLTKILEAWVAATGKDASDFDKIRLGVESDWLCHKAKTMLEKDPTGLLSGITMRAAYRKFIKDNYCTIEDLINGEWNIIGPKFQILKHELYEGNLGPIIDNAVANIHKIVCAFGKEVSIDEIMQQDVEKILVDAFDHYDNLAKDVFKISDGNEIVVPKVSNKLYRFEYYKQFVTALKSSPEDNCIVVALVDRTDDEVKNEYDEKCDKFFAFGIKRNGGIVVVSDRVVRHSLTQGYKTRNPYRDIDNKIQYSHLPYHKLDEIYQKHDVTKQLLLPKSTEENAGKDEFCEFFDLEGYIYLATLLTIIKGKYFDEDSRENWNQKVKVFGSDVLFLTEAQTKALVVVPDNVVTLPSVSTKAVNYTQSENIYNHGVFDHYVDRFPLTSLPPINIDFVANMDDIQGYSWWAVRNAQKKHIEESLSEFRKSKRYPEIFEEMKKYVIENAESLLEYAFSHNDRSSLSAYRMCNGKNDTLHIGPKTEAESDPEDKLPVFYEDYRDHKELNTVGIKSWCETRRSYFYDPPSNRYKRSATMLNLKLDDWWPMVSAWFSDDNDQRAITVEVILRSYSDLKNLLHIEKLPEEMEYYFYDRIDPWSVYGWKPYSGNSILSFTDPMDDIKDPVNEQAIGIRFHVSKTKYKELVKKYGNLRNCEVKTEKYDE